MHCAPHLVNALRVALGADAPMHHLESIAQTNSPRHSPSTLTLHVPRVPPLDPSRYGLDAHAGNVITARAPPEIARPSTNDPP